MGSGKVKAAFKAMKDIGIPEEKTKPALKKLLKLFDKNWDLIEEENYRLLADTIFEFEDTEVAEKEKNKVSEHVEQGEVYEEAVQPQTQDDPGRPLKRLRLKHQNQTASSHGQNGSSSTCTLKTPKPEPGEPEASPTHMSQPVTGSPQSLVRNKGKQPVSPQISSKAKRPPLDRPPQALQIKEPKGAGVIPKQKQAKFSGLIIPKDEPFTDDMPSVEPLAVVLPDRKQAEVPSNSGNLGCSQDGQGIGASKSLDVFDKGLGLSSGEDNHVLEPAVSKKIPASISIADSHIGEVKLLLSFNSTLEQTDFHFQDLQGILKKVDDIFLEKFKIMDPEFSTMKVMTELCEYVGKMITGDGCVNQDRSNQQDAGVIERNGVHSLQSNGSITPEHSDNVAAATDIKETHAPNASPASSIADRDPSAGMNVKSLVVAQQKQVVFGCDASDITRGLEMIKVSLEKSNGDLLPLFHYIPQNVISHNAGLVFSLSQIGEQDSCLSCCGDCLSLSPSCNCTQRNGGDFFYTSDGLLKEVFLDMCISMVRNPQKDCLVFCKECPLERLKNEDMLDPCKGHLKRKFIKECWTKCGCSKDCGNRVIQRGLSHTLQVFLTPEGKGWGLRTMEDIPKGSFICEYVGEILTCTELHKRNLRRSDDKHSYAVLLDTDWGTRELKESEILCLDSTYYGNVSRFINHRCSDANLIEIPVEVETPSHHYYHVALFTTRKINAFEELTWDYGLDFDDGESHIKAFRCLCGSKFCRNMKRSSRSRSTLTIQ
ncbi:unnamed protein product [Amaranthus hypochondriacus]